MPKDKKDINQTLIIDQLTANTKELLNDNYAQANSLRDPDKDVIKISIVHSVSKNEFGEIETESVIAFGKRIKHRVEHTVDLTAQFDFEGKGKVAASETDEAA